MIRALLLLLVLAAPATAASFRWANDGDANSMDPYTRNETFQLGFTQNIYDPLVRRDRDLKLEPALAISWEQPSPLLWRFHLRTGVRFAGGEAFTADDVVFSYQRAIGPGSNIRAFFAAVAGVRKVDDATVVFDMKQPDPIFPQEVTLWAIMSRAWCEAHGATQPADLTSNAENFATRQADGTGPFMLQSREPDRRTTLIRNPGWWDKPEGNVTDVTFDVIGNAATRVAALISGETDMIYTVPPQDLALLARHADLKLIEGPELRTIFLGFDLARDELLNSDVRGRNPLRDIRVRQAFNEAIDIAAIHDKVMLGQSHPTGLIYGPGINGYSAASDIRPAYDPSHARALLAQAGYPDGFALTLDCPNDRFANDAAICQAVTIMLARIGMHVTLNAQTKQKFFAQINAPHYASDFFLLGWTPSTYDALNPLFNLMGTRDGVRGVFNVGGYSNKNFDDLLDRIAVNSDTASRDAQIAGASRILRADYAFIPLHQQTVIWATRGNVTLAQMADNTFPLRFVSVK